MALGLLPPAANAGLAAGVWWVRWCLTPVRLGTTAPRGGSPLRRGVEQRLRDSTRLCSHYSPELVLNAGARDATPEDSHPDGLRHPAPTKVLLTLQPAEIGGGHRQRAVVEKAGDVLDALPCVPAELGRTVTKNV